MLEILLGRMAPLLQPATQGLDRPIARTGLGLACELVDRVRQSLRVTRRREPAGNAGDPVGQVEEYGIRDARPCEQKERAKPLQAFAGAVHAAMALRRRAECRVRQVELGERHAAQAIAHSRRRIETIAHAGLSSGPCRSPPYDPRDGRSRSSGKGKLYPWGYSVDSPRQGDVAASQFCVLDLGSWLVTMSVMTAAEFGTRREHERRAVERDAADRDQRAANLGLPFGETG